MTTATELAQLRELIEGYIERTKDGPLSRRELIEARPRVPESLDPTPMEMPINYGPPSMRELVQEYVREEVSKHAQAEDMGTFEEEDDFEPQDEDLLDLSGFEITEYPMEEEYEPQGDPPEDPPQGSAEPSETEAEEPAPPPVGTT